MIWERFFQYNTEVSILPTKARPKLIYISKNKNSAIEILRIYPAYRTRAKLFKIALYIKTICGLNTKTITKEKSITDKLLFKAKLTNLEPRVVLIGTGNESQKITVQLYSTEGKVHAYLKYADKELAKKRLLQEYETLSSIPHQLRPEIIFFGELDHGLALITLAIQGSTLKSNKKGLSEAENFYTLFIKESNKKLPLHKHPWIKKIKEIKLISNDEFDLSRYLYPLDSQTWPLVPQHGDFSPWNIIKDTESGIMKAIDWEYGTPEGFPLIDIIHYHIQLHMLIYKRKPDYAFREITKELIENNTLSLNFNQIVALIKLTAYYDYQEALQDGLLKNNPYQIWRKKLWNSQKYNVNS